VALGAVQASIVAAHQEKAQHDAQAAAVAMNTSEDSENIKEDVQLDITGENGNSDKKALNQPHGTAACLDEVENDDSDKSGGDKEQESENEDSTDQTSSNPGGQDTAGASADKNSESSEEIDEDDLI
jgi:hypothetical protein